MDKFGCWGLGSFWEIPKIKDTSLPPVNGGEFSQAGSARKHWLRCLVLLRKLGGSGSPGQLLQQQQTKIVQSLGSGVAEN